MDAEILKGGGRRCLALLSLITNAHNELYGFYMGKGSLLKKNSEPTDRGAPHRPSPF